MLKRNITPEKIDRFIFSPAGLLALAAIALLCVMGCAVAMAVSLAPGLASTRAQILQANELRIAKEQESAATPSPTPKIASTTAPAQATLIAAAPGVTPTRATTAIFTPNAASPLPSPTARTPQPAPPATALTPPSAAPTAPTATQPAIAATNPVVLPPTFTALPSATLPSAGVSATLTPTPADLPSATPTPAASAATDTPIPATPTPTAEPSVVATSVITKPGATLVDGAVTISAISKNIDFPSSEYIELTNVGSQNVALKNWALLLKDEPAQGFTFSGVVLEPNQTCRVFTGAPNPGAGGTSGSCSGLTFGQNASLFQIPRRVELVELIGISEIKLKAVYIYVP